MELDDTLRRTLPRFGYSQPGPPPDWLAGPLDRVLADLQGDEPIEIDVSYATTPDGTPAIFIAEAGESGYSSFALNGNPRGAALLFEIAFGLQEQVFPELYASWGQARPECPGHPHSADARMIGDEAWWVCPRDGRPLRRIGERS